MAEKKGGGGGGGSDIWWFLGFLAVFFILWVSGGGPQRAVENGSGSVRLNTPASDTPRPTETPRPNIHSNPPTYVDGQVVY